MIEKIYEPLDSDKNYWKNKDNSEKWGSYYYQNLTLYLEKIKDDLPPGAIYEYGCGDGQMIIFLKKLFPERKVVGIDIPNYNKIKEIREIDVRNIALYEEFREPIALAINDMSGWDLTPISKQSSYCHAMFNLVPSGYYIESRRHQYTPNFIYNSEKLKELEMVAQGLIVFKKMH